MNICKLVALALLVSASPAQADIEARYMMKGEEAAIEVNANGDARIGGDGDSYSLIVEAGNFVVFTDDGRQVAARYEDFHAAIEAMKNAMWGDLGAELPAEPPAETQMEAEPAAPTGLLRAQGERKIGENTGTVYLWKQDGVEEEIAVLSDDPDLRPLGPPMAQLLAQMPSVERALTGEQPPMLVALSEKLGSTALLQMGEDLVLAKVSHGDIADERFTLPATILTRDEVAQMLAE